MTHIWSTELYTNAHFIPIREKLLYLSRFNFYIMVICTWTHANLFESDRFLVFACLIFFLGLLVFVAPKVHQFTDGRHSIRRDFDKIKVAITRDVQCSDWRHHSHHFAILID